MIINASGGNADAVMTVAQTLSDTQKTQARTNIGALSSASGAVAAANLASNAVTTAKITDSNITRAKLAADAKYSPVSLQTASITLAASHVGQTLVTNGSSTSFIFTVPSSTAIPVGYEVAILNYLSSSTKITFASGVKTIVYGNTAVVTAKSFTLETYAMVALKKITSNTWLLTGTAEVV